MALLAVTVWGSSREYWARGNPLARPILATEVHNGLVTLEDGRVLRAAGVVRAPGVSAAQFDDALRAMVAQGVEVTRDLGDGRALLQGEPKFYNSCGTRDRDGSHCLGWWMQEPLSELLVWTGYAVYAPQGPGLSSREKWRLEGLMWLLRDEPSNRKPSEVLASGRIEYGSYVYCLKDLDLFLEGEWKPAPEGE